MRRYQQKNQRQCAGFVYLYSFAGNSRFRRCSHGVTTLSSNTPSAPPPIIQSTTGSLVNSPPAVKNTAYTRQSTRRSECVIRHHAMKNRPQKRATPLTLQQSRHGNQRPAKRTLRPESARATRPVTTTRSIHVRAQYRDQHRKQSPETLSTPGLFLAPCHPSLVCLL